VWDFLFTSLSLRLASSLVMSGNEAEISLSALRERVADEAFCCFSIIATHRLHFEPLGRRRTDLVPRTAQK
jgi:hypothetical protein